MSINDIEQRVRREELLRSYAGADRVVHAKDKKTEISEQEKTRTPFSARTGLSALDECLDGFRRGQLVIVSGPPKNGKTLLCQNLSSRFTKQGHRCAWFEYELNYEEFLAKFPEGEIDFHLPNYMASGNVDWIADRVTESKLKFGTDIVFIDHLDFLRDPDILKGVSLNLSAYVGSIVQKVKRIAVENDLLVFMMSHIRKNDWTTNKLPSSEELRDSGQIAQLADIVMMVIRKRIKDSSGSVYLENDALVGVIENRHNGKTKIVSAQVHEGQFRETIDPILNKPKEDAWII